MDEINIPEERARQISKWACHKLECFADYIEAYARTLRKARCCYIELYAGCGRCVCKGTECRVDDSELRALKTSTKFGKYIFVVGDYHNAVNLEQLSAPHNTDNIAEIINGNCINEWVIQRVFDLIPRSASSFTLIDPPGYRKLRWSTIKNLATYGKDWKGHKMELLIVFPLEMALLRNLTRPECEASITRLYGNLKWQEIKQHKLDGKMGLDKIRHQLVELFKTGLKDLGYKHVVDFRPARFSNPPIYHVILATDGDGKMAKIMEDAWGKQRYLPCELLYGLEAKQGDNTVG